MGHSNNRTTKIATQLKSSKHSLFQNRHDILKKLPLTSQSFLCMNTMHTETKSFGNCFPVSFWIAKRKTPGSGY